VFLKSTISILILSAVAVSVSLAYNFFNLCYARNWWWSILFFVAIFLIVNLIRNLKTNPTISTEIVIGTISIKALLLMVAVFIYSLIDKKGFFCFSMHFLTHYILFTVFEIRYLLTVIKSKKSIRKGPNDAD